MKPHEQAVFIALETTAYSGATLLTALLGSHPGIATVAEMSGLIEGEDPDEYLCSCGQKIKTCDFWQKVKDGMNNRGFEFDVADFNTQFIPENPSLLQRLRAGSSRNGLLDSIRDKILFSLPSPARQLQAMSDRNTAFIETVLEITGKRVFIDSSKDRLRPKALRRFSPLDVRIIQLVRDVRGVVASSLRMDKKLTAAQAARSWCRLHQRVERTAASWDKESNIIIRYEDLCHKTEDTLKRLYTFCGVSPDFTIKNIQTVSHHLIGNDMRLTPISKIQIDTRWQEELSNDQLKEIEEVAGDLGRTYGYY
ncbi:MAG: sulfotransferase [Candidatus Electrothrix sp. GW3-4]|uniref:sulfotransferase n=1 Tax=Candidatus Electrothrix sp. GW3-4 TaxID=3126740 RepID=UPI0030D2FEFB